MINRSRARRSACPISAALEVLGDRWSLLIVRDLIFGGAVTYKDFHGSDEGIATNILASRLSKLQASCIIASEPDPKDSRSRRYRLTAKGMALLPVLMELSAWGTQHEEGQPPDGVLDAWKADREQFLLDFGRSQARH